MTEFNKFTGEAIANAPLLEPAFEGFLRGVDVHEDIVAPSTVQIADRELFTSIDSTKEGLTDTCETSFGIDLKNEGFLIQDGMGESP